MDGSVLQPSEGQSHQDHFSSLDTLNDPYAAEGDCSRASAEGKSTRAC